MKAKMNRAFSWFFQRRVGLILGVSLFVVSLPLYESYTNRVILHRWSYQFFTTILIGCALWLAVLGQTLFVRHRGSGPSPKRRAAAFLDVGVLAWGLAYFISCIEARENAARVLAFNFFGSVVPSAIILEWITLLFLGLWVGYPAWLRLPGSRWSNIALSFATVGLLALAAEGIARAKALLVPRTTGFPTYTSDLWRRRYVELNERGYRDVDHAAPRPKGANRLLVIGDSYAFGQGLKEVQHRFGEQLALRLSSHTGDYWVAINASKRDRHTLHELDLLAEMLVFQPDLVVVLYVFNDIEYLAPSSRYSLAEAPTSIIERLHPVRLLYKNSFLFQALYIRARMIAYRVRAPDNEGDLYSDAVAVNSHLADLCRLVIMGERAGATVGIVPFDVAIVSSPVLRRRYREFVNRAVPFGLPIWPLESAFDSLSYSELTVNSLDGHPNELANRVAAHEIGERLIGQLDSSPRSDCLP